MATLSILALVGALLGAAAPLLFPRLRGLLPWGRAAPPCLRHPVVLAHGLFGFDVLERDGERIEYFQGIGDHLARRGCTVHCARVPPVASVATRAEALADFVRALPHRKVNLVAHSMGGLDARYAIAKLGLASRVASLTTIGTPHHGTPLADLGVAVGKGLGLGDLIERLGLERDAFRDLTTARAAAFNAEVKDVPGVAYASVVGAMRPGKDSPPLLLAGWAYLRSAAGPNDGLVPASSQRWGEVLAEVEADHFGEVGRSRSFDALPLYEQVVAALRRRGL